MIELSKETLSKAFSVIALGIIIGFCWFLIDDKYRGTHVDPLGSSGYTWFVVMHDVRDATGSPTIHEADSKPVRRADGSIEFLFNGDEIWVADNWSVYKMQHR